MKVTFDRVGRNDHVAPLTVADDASADEVARAVARFARPFLLSRDVEVHVDLEAGRGQIVCGGFHSGGSFTTSYDDEPTQATT